MLVGNIDPVGRLIFGARLITGDPIYVSLQLGSRARMPMTPFPISQPVQKVVYDASSSAEILSVNRRKATRARLLTNG